MYPGQAPPAAQVRLGVTDPDLIIAVILSGIVSKDANETTPAGRDRTFQIMECTVCQHSIGIVKSADASPILGTAVKGAPVCIYHAFLTREAISVFVCRLVQLPLQLFHLHRKPAIQYPEFPFKHAVSQIVCPEHETAAAVEAHSQKLLPKLFR